jgi:hypothetical protein
LGEEVSGDSASFYVGGNAETSPNRKSATRAGEVPRFIVRVPEAE